MMPFGQVLWGIACKLNKLDEDIVEDKRCVDVY